MRAGGATLIAALRSVGLSKNTWEAHLRRHPDRRAHYRSITPDAGLARVAAKFDDILATVKAGDGIRAAIAAHGCNDSAFYKYVKRTKGARELLVAAASTRQRTGRRASLEPQRRWTDVEYDAALEAVAHAEGGIAHALEGLPTVAALYGRAARDEEFRVRFNRVMGDRVYRRERAKPPKSPKGNSQHLQRALKANDLYRAALKVTRGIDVNDRDDTISELILAALEGEYTANEFKTKRIAALKRAIGDRNQFRSLDRVLSRTANSDTLGDLVASPCQIQHY